MRAGDVEKLIGHAIHDLTKTQPKVYRAIKRSYVDQAGVKGISYEARARGSDKSDPTANARRDPIFKARADLADSVRLVAQHSRRISELVAFLLPLEAAVARELADAERFNEEL